MAEFMLSVYHDPAQHDDGTVYANESEMRQAFAAVELFNQELRASGVWVFAGGLQPPSQAVVVGRDGEATADGSAGAALSGSVENAAEQAELVAALATGVRLGGFWVVDVSDELAARDLAARAALACGQPIELRAFRGE